MHSIDSPIDLSPSVSECPHPKKPKPAPKPDIPLHQIRQNIAGCMQANGFTDRAAIRSYLDENPQYDLSVAELNLDMRTVNTLYESLGITHVLELLHCKKLELRAVRHIGDKGIENIFAALAEKGIKVPSDQQETSRPSQSGDDAPNKSDSAPAGEEDEKQDPPTPPKSGSNVPSVGWSAGEEDEDEEKEHRPLHQILSRLEEIADRNGNTHADDQQRAWEICRLSGEALYRIRFSWNRKEGADLVAERIDTALSTVQNPEAPIIQKFVAMTRQRIDAIRQEKRGKEKPKRERKKNQRSQRREIQRGDL